MSYFAVLLAATTVLLVAGSSSSADTTNSVTASDPVYRDIARVHWLGKNRIEADTNSTYLMGIWHLPQTERLLSQTVDKLATAPWGEQPATNGATALRAGKSDFLRPLLHDLLNFETVFQVRQATNEMPQAVLAVQLPMDRVEVWSTNLAAILEDLSGCKVQPADPEDGGWKVIRGSHRADFATNNAWTYLRLGGYPEAAARELVKAVRPGNTGDGIATNEWIQLEVDLAMLPQVCDALGVCPRDLPQIRGVAYGDGDYVRSRLTFQFPKPLGLDLPAWQIPTNLVRDPLISFTAARGFGPWLSRLGWLRALGVSPVPNQAFAWAINVSPVHTFAAAPMTNATEFFNAHGRELEGRINSWLTNHAMSSAQYSQTNHGIGWVAMGMLTPAIQALPSSVGEVLFGRLAPTLPPPGDPAPQELLSFVTGTTNLVMYDWEITELRLKHWIYLTQSARMAFLRAQLPVTTAALEFLTAVGPKLGNAITEVKLTDPSTLELTRKSHSGFTAIEWHLLADWLESPKFPRGTFTLLAPPAQVLRWRAATRTFEPSTNLGPVLKRR